MSLLQVSNLAVNYGPISAVSGVTFNVDGGKMVGIIGRNGSGKSTILQSICGLQRASGGSIVFDGKRIDQLPAHEVVRLGIAYVPEGRRVFADLSVHDNLTLGAFTQTSNRSVVTEGFDRVYSMFPILRDRSQQAAGTLSGGQQQMLAIGRALMSKPRLLLLDEPSMGLAPVVVNELFATISQLHKQGLTVLVVEQKAFKTLKMVDLAHVVVHGKIALSGTGAELLANDEVKASYLGKDRAATAAAAAILGQPDTPVALPIPAGIVEPALATTGATVPLISSFPAPIAQSVEVEVIDRTRSPQADAGGVGSPAPVEAASAPSTLPSRGISPGEVLTPRFTGNREKALRTLHQRTRP